MTADVYQQLLDRGWRRSGQYCYFPYNHNTCCPNYSISCNTIKFELTKSQIKCIDKVHSFLINDSTQERVKLSKHVNDNFQARTTWKQDSGSIRDNFEKLKQSPKARQRRFVSSCERIMSAHGISLEEAIKKIRDRPRNSRGRSSLTLEDYLYPRKANLDSSFLNELKPKHRLRIRLVHVDSEESEEMRDREHKILVKYQEAIHKETAEEWSMSRFKNFLVDSPIKTEPILNRHYCHTETGGDESSYELSTNHSVDVISSQRNEFALVGPPELPTHFGTYHCLYLIDDELIAVGVVDFLPKCLTTVYFFYDPKYSNLNLGIYSALVEISIVRHLFKHYQGPSDMNELKHYYMGFYVHQSKKMHYKTTFQPSYLLCPSTRHYVPVKKCLSILKEQKYARFDSDHEPEAYRVRIDTIFRIPVSAPVLDTTKLIDYYRWLQENTSIDDFDLLVDRFMVPYTGAVGTDLSSRILVKLDAIHGALVQRNSQRAA